MHPKGGTGQWTQQQQLTLYGWQTLYQAKEYATPHLQLYCSMHAHLINYLLASNEVENSVKKSPTGATGSATSGYQLAPVPGPTTWLFKLRPWG
jgi:hypothetical protein